MRAVSIYATIVPCVGYIVAALKPDLRVVSSGEQQQQQQQTNERTADWPIIIIYCYDDLFLVLFFSPLSRALTTESNNVLSRWLHTLMFIQKLLFLFFAYFVWFTDHHRRHSHLHCTHTSETIVIFSLWRSITLGTIFPRSAVMGKRYKI